MGYPQDPGNKTEGTLPFRLFARSGKAAQPKEGETMITVLAFAIALSAVFLLLVGSRACVTVRARRAPERSQGSPGRYWVR